MTTNKDFKLGRAVAFHTLSGEYSVEVKFLYNNMYATCMKDRCPAYVGRYTLSAVETFVDTTNNYIEPDYQLCFLHAPPPFWNKGMVILLAGNKYVKESPDFVSIYGKYCPREIIDPNPTPDNNACAPTLPCGEGWIYSDKITDIPILPFVVKQPFPNPVTNLTATVGIKSVRLTWTAPTNVDVIWYRVIIFTTADHRKYFEAFLLSEVTDVTIGDPLLLESGVTYAIGVLGYGIYDSADQNNTVFVEVTPL